MLMIKDIKIIESELDSLNSKIKEKKELLYNDFIEKINILKPVNALKELQCNKGYLSAIMNRKKYISEEKLIDMIKKITKI